jgi:2-haloacid dehalogenase
VSPPYRAVLFDLLTGLLDSWSLWNRAAGNGEAGLRWRKRYLDLTYGQGDYRDYEALVRRAAEQAGLPASAPDLLLATWDDLEPWPEASGMLRRLALPFGVVTNCSEALAQRAAARLPVAPTVVISAERAGAYKPDPRPYRLALDGLAQGATVVAFVAGSPFDLPGAAGLGLATFWHNRLGLTRPAGFPAPIAEAGNLVDLGPWLTGAVRR